MDKNLTNARNLLDSGNYTCVVCLGETVYTTTHRGVAPLLNWLDSGTDLSGFSAADRVVGRGAAFLYCLLKVKAVYARVMSRPAAEVLKAYGIEAYADTFVDGIINRTGTGPCPFEAAVMHIQEAGEALAAIRRTRTQMQKEN
jgi:hypothetical protein